MNQSVQKMLFALFRSSLYGDKLSEAQKTEWSEAWKTELTVLCQKHDLIHLLALALRENGLVDSKDPELKKSLMMAVYRYERMDQTYQSLCQVLEKSGIPFMPLKGVVIRTYYPEPWMRTSCDIDILVQENDVEAVSTLLIKHHGYTYQEKGSHNYSLYSPEGTHVELHYSLIEEGLVKDAASVLRRVWDVAVLRNGYRYWYEMLDEMFYFYHIAHMAKHVLNGGCGIKPFVDLWMLDHMEQADHNKREALLRQGNLIIFAEAARKLSKLWYDGSELDAPSAQLAHYVLYGGVYGNAQNAVAVQQQKQGGRWQYIWRKIFLPYDMIKTHYPILQKYRWLTPILEIYRWFRAVFRGSAKQTAEKMRINMAMSSEDAEKTAVFLDNVGLQ